MKMKLTSLMFGLLLAAGWTSNASAQLKADQPMKLKNLTEFLDKGPFEVANVNGHQKGNLKAPSRTPNTITADVTHVYSWYDAITYDWVDADGNPQNSKITEPATTAEQMAYLLGTTYMNPNIPGIQYTEGWETIHPYNSIGFGWDIPNNARWNYDGETAIAYDDITIIPDASNMQYINYTWIYSIRVVSGNTTITSWTYADNGTYLPSGWSLTGSNWTINNAGYLYADTRSRDHSLTISRNLLTGYNNVQVIIVARDYNYNQTGYRRIIVNDETQNLTSSDDLTYTWDIASSGSTKVVTKPYENGYTVFLVKVKDTAPKEPYWVYTWDDLIDYFDTHIDEVQLLTDGTRLNEGTEDAGTMFSYSGELNRFYFASKGKMFYLPEDDLAPTNSMYEEFSAHTAGEDSPDVTDFYSKLLYGNSYNIIHDCQGVNGLEHYFSMTGKAGTEHRSVTNLIFWIPDQRGVSGTRNYDEEFLPHVGLYNIILEAEATPAANYSEDNRMYDVTLDWVSTLNTILDFPVDQDYEIWIYIYDENGNPVEQRKVGTTHNTTTYTYQEPQHPDSYTIIYRIKGWPSGATNNPANGGDFFALSNLDPVLIPGYNDFLSLGVDHYESDFAIAEEHNYYRNFLTLDNQNPQNALTAKRIENGDSAYVLNRFDVDVPGTLTKAADLVFAKKDNKINFSITYANQQYIDDANQTGMSQQLTGYKDPNALGYPTSGTIATISEGGTIPGPVDEYVRVTSTDEITSGGQYLIVYENDNVAFNGALTSLDQGNNVISVNRNDNIIEANATTDAATFTITRSGSYYNIRSASGYYIGRTSNNNGMDVSQNTAYNNSIYFSGNNVVIRGRSTGWWPSDTYYLRFNSSTGNNNYRFRYYGQNSQQAIQLYKRVTEENPGLTLLNNFLDNSTYTQYGIVIFELPWKSINVKLQDSSAGSSAGYFMIQSDGKLRFVMPAGYNNASLKFVIHNAPVSSEYYDGTFTLTSSTGDTQTIIIPTGNNQYGDRDYEAIFTGISTGDVITITGTHTENGTVYNYSPDFKYIHVYVEGGHDGIGENEALNLAAIKFMDQFKAETSEDKHPRRYGYVLKPKVGNEESGKPEIPVQHANSMANGFYTLAEIQGDTKAELTMNVMNADVNMTLARDPEIYYYTLDRKPNTATTWEELSKLQRREDDSYQEMYDKLAEYDDQVCTPPADATAVWTVERYDSNILTGEYNDYMSYVPIIWTHGEMPSNRRIKWNTEQRHNSYGSPIWKTGVAEVDLQSVKAERQNSASTNWTYGGEDCSLYMLNGIKAVATMPTVNNVKYVPYMFRIFVKSKNNKLRGYTQVPQGEGQYDGEHYEGAPIDDESLQCVWSTYLNETEEALANMGVTIGITPDDNGRIKTITFEKNKVTRPVVTDDWTFDEENAIFAGLKDIITGSDNNMAINPDDLTIFVRFYYILESMMPTTNTLRAGDGNPGAGYGAEGAKAPDPATSVDEIRYHGEIVSTTYVNTQGMQSDRPFDGVNIVITRYSDGATTVSKVVR
jgi:hypothetical protein